MNHSELKEKALSNPNVKDAYELTQRRLALLEGLAKGERAILVGRTTSHGKARERMEKWLR